MEEIGQLEWRQYRAKDAANYCWNCRYCESRRKDIAEITRRPEYMRDIHSDFHKMRCGLYMTEIEIPKMFVKYYSPTFCKVMKQLVVKRARTAARIASLERDWPFFISERFVRYHPGNEGGDF